jgi:hypothetical protein
MHDADEIRPLSLIHVKAESRDGVNPKPTSWNRSNAGNFVLFSLNQDISHVFTLGKEQKKRNMIKKKKKELDSI